MTEEKTMSNLEIVMVPKELYYHEVAYVRGLESEIERLRAALEKIAGDGKNSSISHDKSE